MTLLSVNQDAPLTDALERDLLIGSMDEQSNFRLGASLKAAASAVARAMRAFFTFMDEVDETMNRAREESARYTRAHW